MLNRVLKVMIGLVLISFLVFLMIGLPKTNHEITSSFSVEKPIEEVYNYILDVENSEKWLEGFISAKKVKGKRGQVGSIYEISMMEFGKITEKTQTLTALIPHTNIEFEWDKVDAFGSISINLEQAGTATKVNELHNFKGKGFVSRFIIKTFKKFIIKAQATSQENLKKAIEEHQAIEEVQSVEIDTENE